MTPKFLSGAMGDQGKIKSSVVPVREPSRDVRCALDIQVLAKNGSLG